MARGAMKKGLNCRFLEQLWMSFMLKYNTDSTLSPVWRRDVASAFCSTGHMECWLSTLPKWICKQDKKSQIICVTLLADVSIHQTWYSV